MGLEFKSFEKLSENYDLFLFDVQGVIHKGQVIDEGSLDVFKQLHLKGKNVGIVSNSPLSITVLREHLQRVGIKPNYYQSLATGGGELMSKVVY